MLDSLRSIILFNYINTNIKMNKKIIGIFGISLITSIGFSFAMTNDTMMSGDSMMKHDTMTSGDAMMKKDDSMMKHDDSMMKKDMMMKHDIMMSGDSMMKKDDTMMMKHDNSMMDDMKKLSTAMIAKKMWYNWSKDKAMLAKKLWIKNYSGNSKQNSKIRNYLISMKK